ncbi:MAG: hypothetical protein PHV23_05945 [Candidatus Gracilibacteria bacterium]|nr:hypothetical protein [Candidatus Gracilibacteria bacterium]
MKSQETLQILKQIFDLNPELEEVILEKLKNLDETKEKELLTILLDYTKKQNELIQELNRTLIKGKNELEEINEESNEETAEQIISKI